ncbi:Asp23/Gls24 family envelope stress response protein [Exiguobacterium flavidum]|uniref:Asp23/Gls24 family envelope stress response protein n=1 Tax=Exiguobacterium flavidum TaxID=2184695 RepID=UPI000DF803FB|nr:Asp23/Gls24 family envelope stress response protein [Exiguobacterium flavidum]
MSYNLNNEDGAVNVSQQVIEVIAGAAVKETAGIAFTQDDSKLQEKHMVKLVKVENTDGEITVNLSVYVKYGESIVKAASKVQERIVQDMENMLSFQPKAVNVRVVGLLTA